MPFLLLDNSVVQYHLAKYLPFEEFPFHSICLRDTPQLVFTQETLDLDGSRCVPKFARFPNLDKLSIVGTRSLSETLPCDADVQRMFPNGIKRLEYRHIDTDTDDRLLLRLIRVAEILEVVLYDREHYMRILDTYSNTYMHFESVKYIQVRDA